MTIYSLYIFDRCVYSKSLFELLQTLKQSLYLCLLPRLAPYKAPTASRWREHLACRLWCCFIYNGCRKDKCQYITLHQSTEYVDIVNRRVQRKRSTIHTTALDSAITTIRDDLGSSIWRGSKVSIRSRTFVKEHDQKAVGTVSMGSLRQTVKVLKHIVIPIEMSLLQVIGRLRTNYISMRQFQATNSSSWQIPKLILFDPSYSRYTQVLSWSMSCAIPCSKWIQKNMVSTTNISVLVSIGLCVASLYLCNTASSEHSLLQ